MCEALSILQEGEGDMPVRRKDSMGRVLKEGEYQRNNGTYEYRWRDHGKRCYVYGKTLEELREKEKDVIVERGMGIRTNARNMTVNDVYQCWVKLKKGLKDNTFVNYQYMYQQFVQNDLGLKKVNSLKRSDIRRFYNRLVDDKGLKISTIDSVHTVLHQVLDLAVEDEYLRSNPADNALKELRQICQEDTKRRKALTLEEHQLLMKFLSKNTKYHRWWPIVTIMIEGGLRVGEVTGLRWEDIDLEEGTISVNHTLVYYSREKGKLSFGVNTPKTAAGQRVIPMTQNMKTAFKQEKEFQQFNDISCQVTVDGYTDFIFLNRFGNVQHYGTINKALKRIIRDCNEWVLEQKDAGKIDESEVILLPDFSCHSLRHTCATRLCEAGTNIKVIQDMLGHADIETTMNIYVEATKELKKIEVERYAAYLENCSK